MKIHSPKRYIVLFFIILSLFALPPLFAAPLTEGFKFKWDFPLRSVVSALFCLSLYLYSKKIIVEKNDRKCGVLKTLFFAFSIFICCILSSRLFTYLSMRSSDSATLDFVTLPQKNVEWLFCWSDFFCAAYSEEVLYRFYFPESILFFIRNNFSEDKKSKLFSFLSELIVLLLFAFAHRYAGWFSVFNAAICHVLFRFMYKKTERLYVCWIVHFLYNILQLFIICL